MTETQRLAVIERQRTELYNGVLAFVQHFGPWITAQKGPAATGAALSFGREFEQLQALLTGKAEDAQP
jgi:hypothetical protein